MPLFENPPSDADAGYLNLFKGNHPTERKIRDELEKLWQVYRPYADTEFSIRFARKPSPHFWEMYLTVQLINVGKNVRPRSELTAANRDIGPDICIHEAGRTVWIEAVTPEVGAHDNPDRVPSFKPINEGGEAHYAPRRQVELRITSSLSQKRDRFEQYRQNGIVAERDLCVVAISGAQFWAQSSTITWPPAVTAVYPVGDPYAKFDKATSEIIDSGYTVSEQISRVKSSSISRKSFLDSSFSKVFGIIWSRITIGSFLYKPHDFCFIHNHAAIDHLRFPKNWFEWAEEYIVDETRNKITVTRTSPENEPQ